MDGYPIHMHKFSQISYVDRVHGSRSDNLNGGKHNCPVPSAVSESADAVDLMINE